MVIRNRIVIIFFCIGMVFDLTFFNFALAGEPISGEIRYEINLSEEYAIYELKDEDYKWINSLLKKFNYKDEVLIFLKTTLKLKKNGNLLHDQVYSTEDGNIFFINEGDAIIDFNHNILHSPGSGGFSVHANKSRNFIVCLNYTIGVEFERSSSPKKNSIVWWYGGDFKRLK